jgi:hypothetical protein
MPRHKKQILEDIEKRIVGSELLGPQEKAEILKQAREQVEETRKKGAVEAFLKAAIKEEERAFEPTEVYEDFTVDLAPYAPYIQLNGMRYFHGLTYEVKYSQARCMADIQQATWQHDREIHGQRRRGDMARDPFGKGINAQRNTQFSMNTGAVTTRDSL